MHAKLLADDKSTKFFSGLDKKSLFDSLHDCIAPFVKRCFKGVSRVVNHVRRHIPGGRQRGPKRKLDSKDEFLLAMMKLHLALLINDLPSRFHISYTLCGQIFNMLDTCNGQSTFFNDICSEPGCT